MDFLRGWNLVASSFLKQGKTSGSSSEDLIHKNDKAILVEENIKGSIEEVWTENDTGDIMDLMETALTNVKKKLLTKLKRSSTQSSEQVDIVKKEEMEVERLEDFISSVQTNTMEVVEEINSVMQIIAEVTTEDTEVDADIPEIDPADTRVGFILGTAQDNEARENWQRLMRKLSTKRKKSIKRKSKRNTRKFEDSESTVCMNPQVSSNFNEHNTYDFYTNENDEEDCIPEDWKPDFIPTYAKEGMHLKNNQPDLIPVDVEEHYHDEDYTEEVSSPHPQVRKRMNTIPQTRRSENRRYLRKQLVELHRQSWA